MVALTKVGQSPGRDMLLLPGLFFKHMLPVSVDLCSTESMRISLGQIHWKTHLTFQWELCYISSSIQRSLFHILDSLFPLETWHLAEARCFGKRTWARPCTLCRVCSWLQAQAEPVCLGLPAPVYQEDMLPSRQESVSEAAGQQSLWSGPHLPDSALPLCSQKTFSMVPEV